MSKSKTNALDALRALIAERQQYDQWISTLESKRDGTVEHVFNRVYSDYRSRLDRVVGEIRGHAEELQLSIAALSSRLGEVAKEEEAKRDTMSEAELRAAVGEYDVAQWESMQVDSKRQLDKIAADRASLEGQLAELESIRKLSEVSAPSGEGGAAAAMPAAERAKVETARAEPQKAEQQKPAEAARVTEPTEDGPITFVRADRIDEPPPRKQFSDAGWPARDIVEQAPAAAARPEPAAAKPSKRPFDSQPSAPPPSQPAPARASATPAPPAAPPISANMDPALAEPRPSATPVAPPRTPTPPRNKRDTPTGKDAQISSGFSKPIRTPADARPEVNKTLKCPECGTPNYPTEWYCERCGGELATM
ncbi:MAG: zinc finger Ran-binding domain-containing protein [Gemmatimonadota bacterium]|nr:zinc finger Ran-binding domain-containing protein [Gemmatimonadota bacterium]